MGIVSWQNGRMWATRLGLGLLALVLTGSPVAAAGGVVIKQIEGGGAAQLAGLKAGDRLLTWNRGEEPENPGAGGKFHSPLDLKVIEIREAPLGPITLTGEGTRGAFSLALPPGTWGISSRPVLDAGTLDVYQEAEKQADDGDPTGAAERLGALASSDRQAAGKNAWLLHQAALWQGKAGNWEESDALFDQAVTRLEPDGQYEQIACLRLSQGDIMRGRNRFDAATSAYEKALAVWQKISPSGLGVATCRFQLGQVDRSRADLESAEKHYRESLRLRQELAPRSLATAEAINYLGITIRRRAGPGDFDSAESYHRQALEIQQQVAPASLDVATTYNSLGNIDLLRGDLPAAEERYEQALEIRARLAPGGLRHTATLDNLAVIVQKRGDQARAGDLFRQVLEIRQALSPGSMAVSMSLNRLGIVASERGNFVSGVFYLQQSLEIRERLAPGSDLVALTLGNLGETALIQGDLEAAKAFQLRALQIREANAPDSLPHAQSLSAYGRVALLEGDLDTARTNLAGAMEIYAEMAPDSLMVASLLKNLGESWQRSGNLERAEELYAEALKIRRRLAPGSSYVATILHKLGSVAEERRQFASALDLYRRALEIRTQILPGSWIEADSAAALARVHRLRQEHQSALPYLQQAVAALEIQQARLGGSNETRAVYRSRNMEIYRDLIDLLVDLNRQEDAYRVLELSRGRSILALLAERDLIFSADIPSELDRERRMVAAEYDRTQQRLADLSGDKNDQQVRELRAELQSIHRRQEAIRERIRQSSPHLAALQYPEPLDLAGSRQALDAGTALLSYSVGKARTHLFSINPAGTLRVQSLTLDEKALREKVVMFRRTIESTRTGDSLEELHALGRELYENLIAPAAEALGTAERILIVPDGPLHLLPFAALVAPASETERRWRYLVEWKPVHVAASVTVWEELKKERPAGLRESPTTLLAFGDPLYPRNGASVTANHPDLLLPASMIGGLRPLPATREEVLAIANLFGEAATALLGPEATEARAKNAGSGPNLIHFAAHGILDPQVPLDSAIALSMPENPEFGGDNGLLQVWEIFESLRIRADLVTLSGCETALGQELAGEGMVGLTRAFQYAGARTVLASLWSVTDRSTAELMKRFYGYLRNGQTKDQALRSAQVDMIRGSIADAEGTPVTRGVKVLAKGTGEVSYASPFYWAAFQLFGDWR